MTGRVTAEGRSGLRLAAGALALAVALLSAACGEEDPETQAVDEGEGTDEPRGAATPTPPGETPALGDEAVAFTLLFAEAYTGVEEPRRAVVRDPGEWREVWSQVVAGREPKPDPPAVNFDRDMVVIVALGVRPTGGNGVKVVEVRRNEDTLDVVVMEHLPGLTCPVTMALTAPVIAVTIPATDAAVAFSERTATTECR